MSIKSERKKQIKAEKQAAASKAPQVSEPGLGMKEDGFGGLIVPDEVMLRLQKNGVFRAIMVDGVPYPYASHEGERYPIVHTSLGWTIGGKNAEEQHAKNVADEKKTQLIARQMLAQDKLWREVD